MDRRTFLIRSAMLAAGGLAVTMLPGVAEAAEMAEAAAKAAGDGSLRFDAELYHRFANRSYGGGGTGTKGTRKSCAASCAS